MLTACINIADPGQVKDMVPASNYAKTIISASSNGTTAKPEIHPIMFIR